MGRGMNCVYEYRLKMTDLQNLGELCLWALVNEYADEEIRTIEIIGTENLVGKAERKFIGTAHMSDGLVWHVFEDKK